MPVWLVRPLIFTPLGVQIRSWQRSPVGRYFGGNNLALTPRGLLRFGQLYLHGGRADGRGVGGVVGFAQRLLQPGGVDGGYRLRHVSLRPVRAPARQ